MKTTFSPGSIVGLALILMCVAANSIHSNPLLFLAGVGFVPLFLNLFWAWFRLRRLHVQRTMPKTAFANEEFPCEMELISRVRGGFSCMSVQPFPTLPVLYRLERVQEFSPRKQETHRVLNYSLEFLKRGVFDVSDFQISCNYPFGLFTWARRFQTQSETITVFPALTETRDIWKQLEFPPQSEAFRTFEGDFAGLRLWTAGDSLRRIHWRASARHGQFLTAKTDAPTPLSIFLIADLTDSDSREVERRVSLTASLMWEICQKLTPFTLGARTVIWLKVIEKEGVHWMKSDETDDFCVKALTLLAKVQTRDASLPSIDSTAEIEAFQNTYPAPNVLWLQSHSESVFEKND